MATVNEPSAADAADFATSTPFALTEITAPSAGPATTAPDTDVVAVAGVFPDPPPPHPKITSDNESNDISLIDNDLYEFILFSFGSASFLL
jgi:hypothetical protein